MISMVRLWGATVNTDPNTLKNISRYLPFCRYPGTLAKNISVFTRPMHGHHHQTNTLFETDSLSMLSYQARNAAAGITPIGIILTATISVLACTDLPSFASPLQLV